MGFVEVIGSGEVLIGVDVSMKEVGPLENEIVLSKALEREVELYAFENSMVSARIAAEKKYEEAQRNFERVQLMYDDILQSRTWRFSAPLRKVSHWLKSQFRNSVLGRLTLRIFKKIFG